LFTTIKSLYALAPVHRDFGEAEKGWQLEHAGRGMESTCGWERMVERAAVRGSGGRQGEIFSKNRANCSEALFTAP
jgi:hypothetical protein